MDGTAVQRLRLQNQGGPIAFGTSENRHREAVSHNFRVAVCCGSARIRRSHDLTVTVDELCNR
jgi:hypothetical protein